MMQAVPARSFPDGGEARRTGTGGHTGAAYFSWITIAWRGASDMPSSL